MTVSRKQREINGALWIASGASVIVLRFLFFKGSAFQAWLVVGVVMIVIGLGQIWRVRRTRRMDSTEEDSSNPDLVGETGEAR